MLAQIDYRKKRYYHRDLHGVCKSHTNKEGEGIRIGHQQFGDIEIPLDAFEEIAVNYLAEHGWNCVKIALGGARK